VEIPEPIVQRVAAHANDLYRGIFLARRAEGRLRRRVGLDREPEAARGPAAQRTGPGGRARRNVLLITADQQRWDALGCHGQPVARTPNLDALAAAGIDYGGCHVQNVVCMPSRSTMLTGQHPRTHGVVANGVALPHQSRSVADVLRRAGYRTALLGKAHFQPHLDLLHGFDENRLASQGQRGPWYGFEHVELAGHGPTVPHHYTDWLHTNHPEAIGGFATVLTGDGGGDTGAPEVHHNPIPRDQYHTDWCADRALAWIRAQGDDPWLCWLSFPDPHHPFDPPIDEVRKRVDWRDVPLPDNHLRGAAAEAVLAQKPAHWLGWLHGTFTNPEGGPTTVTPSALTDDMIRETTAMIAVENELIDDAVGRVLAELEARGLAETTDVLYTSDHGDLGGDYGLVFKGPYHVDALMRVPLLWRPAPVAEVAPAAVPEPVGLVDLAPTICSIAGVEVPADMEGDVLPTAAGSGRERVLTTWDSQFANVGMHLRTIHRDGLTCTRYEPTTTDVGGRFRLYWQLWARGCEVPRYDGSEGELYDHAEDPHQRTNLWDNPARCAQRDDLLTDLADHLPEERLPRLPVAAPT
jgi:arylsulfatase A-like enzyme